jgi:hypothetical protein
VCVCASHRGCWCFYVSMFHDFRVCVIFCNDLQAKMESRAARAVGPDSESLRHLLKKAGLDSNFGPQTLAPLPPCRFGSVRVEIDVFALRFGSVRVRSRLRAMRFVSHMSTFMRVLWATSVACRMRAMRVEIVACHACRVSCLSGSVGCACALVKIAHACGLGWVS